MRTRMYGGEGGEDRRLSPLSRLAANLAAPPQAPRSQMDEFKFFKNFKERGEWVEARFMADAMRHGYKVLKPWGDSQPFDVAL